MDWTRRLTISKGWVWLVWLVYNPIQTYGVYFKQCAWVHILCHLLFLVMFTDPGTSTTSSASQPLESRSSVDNCAKNLFSSPGTKRGFTRHHSLVKLVKSIQNDRRKINSAPSSPIKMTGEPLLLIHRKQATDWSSSVFCGNLNYFQISTAC